MTFSLLPSCAVGCCHPGSYPYPPPPVTTAHCQSGRAPTLPTCRWTLYTPPLPHAIPGYLCPLARLNTACPRLVYDASRGSYGDNAGLFCLYCPPPSVAWWDVDLAAVGGRLAACSFPALPLPVRTTISLPRTIFAGDAFVFSGCLPFPRVVAHSNHCGWLLLPSPACRHLHSQPPLPPVFPSVTVVQQL